MSQQPSENPQTPVDRFFAAASTGLTQWWRWVLGVIVAVFIWQIATLVLVLPVGFACLATEADIDSPWLACANGAESAGIIPGFVLLNLGFLVGLIGIWIVVRRLHKKSLTQATTGRASFDYSRFLYAALVGLCVMIVIILAYRFILGVEVTLQSLNLWVYLPFVLIALVLTPIQASFEEVLFRGYIMQGLSLLTRNRLVLALVTAAIFTVPHLLNPEPFAYGFAFYILDIVSFGIVYAALTLLDGGIELAAGYHAINNLFLGLIANPDASALATPSLFVVNLSQAPLLAVYCVDVFSLVVVLVILNMKYRWFAYPWSKSANRS